MAPGQGTAQSEQDNLSILIECLTPRVSITTSNSFDSAGVQLASVWRFFDAPFGHLVLFPRPDGSFLRTYWMPVLSSIEIHPVQASGLSISSTASMLYNESMFNSVVYTNKKPVSERPPLLETIKLLALTNPIIHEGSVRSIDPSSWFSVVWTQIGVDPRHADLQRDHLLFFYKFNTAQTRSWIEHSTHSDTDSYFEVYINYNKFYSEERSASNKQVRFSFSEITTLVSPLKTLNLSAADLQRHLDEHDRTYSLLTVQSDKIPTYASDVSWARGGFSPEKSFTCPGVINSLKKHKQPRDKRDSMEENYTPPEDRNLLPHTTLVSAKCNDYSVTKQKKGLSGWVGIEFLRMKDAFYSHHLCRETVPSPETLLDVFNCFVSHLPLEPHLQVENSKITLRGNVSQRCPEAAMLLWNQKRGYLLSDDQVHSPGAKKSTRLTAEDIRRAVQKAAHHLSEYPANIVQLYVILTLLCQQSNYYTKIPAYYRIIINAAYYNRTKRIMGLSKTSVSNKYGNSSSENVNINASSTTPLSEASPSGDNSTATPGSRANTIGQVNYPMDVMPPYDVLTFAPIAESRITSILESLTIDDLHTVLYDLMKCFYQPSTYYITRALSATSGIKESLQYLHDSGFQSILSICDSPNSSDIQTRHTAALQLVLTHPIFAQSAAQSQSAISAIFQRHLPPSQTYRYSHRIHADAGLQSEHALIVKISLQSDARKPLGDTICQSGELSENTSISPAASMPSTMNLKDDTKAPEIASAVSTISVINDPDVYVFGSSNSNFAQNKPFSSSSSHTGGCNSYLQILLEPPTDNDSRLPGANGNGNGTTSELEGEAVSPRAAEAQTTTAATGKPSRRKEKDLSIRVGKSLSPGDKKRYEKIILEQYREFIHALRTRLSFKHKEATAADQNHPTAVDNAHTPYLLFYRRFPLSDCSCKFCHQAFTATDGDSGVVLRLSTPVLSTSSSRVSIDTISCETTARKLLRSPAIRQYISSDKSLSRFIHFASNYKLTEFSDLATTATKFLSSRSITGGIRLSFLGCLPLETSDANLSFYSTADNSEENIRRIRAQDSRSIVKIGNYPILYHIFLEIIFKHVPMHHELSELMLPKLDKFILETKKTTKAFFFTDTIDDSAIQRRGSMSLSGDASRQRSSSVEGRNRGNEGKKKHNKNRKHRYDNHAQEDKDQAVCK